MPRIKLTEYKSKSLLYSKLGISYGGVSVFEDSSGKFIFTPPLSYLSPQKEYVVKVDQGVKGRMKKGLVKLKVKSEKLKVNLNQLVAKGYSRFIVEEMLPHKQDQERYISIERVREGLLIRYSKFGGIEVEKMKEKVEEAMIETQIRNSKSEISNKSQNSIDKKIQTIAKKLGVSVNFIQSLLDYFEHYYVSFLEINPLVISRHPELVSGSKMGSRIMSGMTSSCDIYILDLAVEVDSTAKYLISDGWADEDVAGDRLRSPEEQAVKQIGDKSQAALSYTVLNPDGAIWVLLSGGGASITIADEIYNLGFGEKLGNYGEYSGNPSADETYLYAREVIKAMLKSKSKKKVVIIGGGVANFTDVRVTFSGVLRAFEEFKVDLKKNHIKVYVRRGGPMEKEGLQMMKNWLEKNDCLGLVSGPEMPLHEIVRLAITNCKL